MYVPLCDPWPLPPSGCPDLSGLSDEVREFAVLAASEALWMRTGYRYGSCQATVRPCRQSCAPSWAHAGGPWWWDGASWPVLTPGSALWWSVACGCRTSCGCTDADELLLPGLVQSVDAVVVDGVTLDQGTHWLLYDGRRLVRTDGERWPLCQDWTVTGGPGTWAVTATYGQPVPALGQLAVAHMAADLASGCTGGPCRLPRNTSNVSRQGVTVSMPSPAELAEADLTVIPAVNEFLLSLRAGAAALPPRIWNPDDYDRSPRRLGGAWG